MSIKIENTQVFGWEAAIRGARNPMNSWLKSDSKFHIGTFVTDDQITEVRFEDVRSEIVEVDLKDVPYSGYIGALIGPADHKLLMNLCKGGTEEAKWRRMIHVQMDVTAPLYWWKEFETYKVGTVSNSCSTMHKIHAKEFTLEDFSCEHLFREPEDSPNFVEAFLKDMEEWSIRGQEMGPNNYDENANPMPDSIDEREIAWHEANGAYETGENWDDDGNRWVEADYAIDVLYATIRALNAYRSKFLETKDKRYWWQMIQLLPTSYNQKRTIDLNYEVLASQYRQRKEHKLDEWRAYCEWIKTLPYSEFITMEERNEPTQ